MAHLFRSTFPDVTYPDMPLSEFVLGAAKAHGDKLALTCGQSGVSLTYAQLLEQVRRLAAGLSQRGIAKGDVVAIWAPNSPEYALAFHAVATLGAIVTTANPVSTVEEVAFQFCDSKPKILLTVAALVDRAREVVAVSQLPMEIVTFDQAGDLPTLASIAVDADPPRVSINPAEDVVVLPYSSGTTGFPKGVMLTHRNLVAQLAQLDAIEIHGLDTFLGVLPFFHIYGMVVIMNFALMRGAHSVTLPRFDLEAVLKIIQDWKIRMPHIVPPVAVAFGKHPIIDNYDLSHVEWLFSGAAPLGEELTEVVEKRCSLRVRQGYGMTEASPATHYTVAGRERAGKAGQLMPSTEGRIVCTETGRDMGIGERGEVWVRGPQVMKGYLNNPEATALTVDADGWLHTGDIGFMDEDGYLEVVDRLKELIKVKGFQVAPAELEALLLKHPSIADVAVIPFLDPELGEVPKAVVVKRGELSANDVMEFVASHVSHYKRIKHVEFVDAIPKSPSGKILRRVLVAKDRAAVS